MPDPLYYSSDLRPDLFDASFHQDQLNCNCVLYAIMKQTQDRKSSPNLVMESKGWKKKARRQNVHCGSESRGVVTHLDNDTIEKVPVLGAGELLQGLVLVPLAKQDICSRNAVPQAFSPEEGSRKVPPHLSC